MPINSISFTINVANATKKSKKPKVKRSHKCSAIVKIINGEYKAFINYSNNSEITNDQLVIPFTDKSLSLKDKIYVWSKKRDNHNRQTCIIRDYITASLHPGVEEQYDVLIENLLVYGYIINVNGKMYFEYEDVLSFHYLSPARLIDIKIDNTKPLFNK